jgi:methylated-DNA-[protein]-cysteine S-methyltransferase
LGDYKETSDVKIFKDTIKWLTTYFSGKKPDFNLPIQAEGSPFRKEVWEMLSEIPYGETTTYGALAKKLAKKRASANSTTLHRESKKVSARSVGGAVGHNPISLIVPCHRVILANGSLTGYAGGIEKKKRLLALETH